MKYFRPSHPAASGRARARQRSTCGPYFRRSTFVSPGEPMEEDARRVCVIHGPAWSLARGDSLHRARRVLPGVVADVRKRRSSPPGVQLVAARQLVDTEKSARRPSSCVTGAEDGVRRPATRSALLAFSATEAARLVCLAVVGAGQVDEVVGDEPVANCDCDLAVSVAWRGTRSAPRAAALARASAGSTCNRASVTARGRAQGTARAGAAEGGRHV